MGQVEDIMTAWKKQVDNEVRTKCITLARQVLQRALYYREQLVAYNIGHNFTGNFVNSIVCGVWENGANISMLLGSKFVGHAPIMAKMTTRKDGKGRTYIYGQALKENIKKKHPDAYVVHPGPDFDDSLSSYYATEKTNTKLVGDANALDFIKKFHPSIRKGFVIALGYPVEYAEFIEKLRASTGLALVEDEYSSKIEQIRKFFMFDSEIKATNSGLSTDVWDKIFATNTAYSMGVSMEDLPNAVNEILNQMGNDNYHLQPGLGNNITFVPSDVNTQNSEDQFGGEDPFGGAPIGDEVPF